MIRGLLATIAALAGSPLCAADLVTVAGARSSGALVAVTAKGVTLRDGAGVETTTPANEVGSVTLSKSDGGALPRHDRIELVDGSTLCATAIGVKGAAVELTPLKPGVAFEVPLPTLFWVARNADDAEAMKAFLAVVAGRGKRDLFVVKQANGLNPLPGTVISGNDAGTALVFEREDGRRVNLPLNRATGGLVFNQPPRAVVPPTLCRVVDRAGNSLVAQSVLVEAGRVTVTTLAGCVARYDSPDLLEKLDFARGNVQYLAEMTGRADAPPAEDDGPLGKEFGYAPPLVTNKAVGGGPIVLGGTQFAKGVSVPPGVSVAYPLAGKFREFRATVGVQDGPNRQAVAMRLRLELDGRAVFDEVIKATAPPRELAIDLRDARELRIAVERAGPALDGDQLNLADARVQK